MKIRTIIAALTAFAFAGAVFAQDMVIATGGKSGIYYPIANDLQTFCGVGDSVKVLETGGSLDNHKRIWQTRPSEATAGIFQYDFAIYMREQSPVWQRSMSVVARLHDEYLQIIAPNQTVKEGGFDLSRFGLGRNVGGSSRVVETLGDLKGQTVYAWGGSYYSAVVLSNKFDFKLNVVDLSGTKPDGKGGYVQVKEGARPELVAAMLIVKGEGVAIISVGGSNLSWVKEENGFNKQWKLLSVSKENHDKVAGTYGIGEVSYLNLSGGKVRTLTVPALLMTRTYSSPERVKPIVALQNCIRDKITTLRDEGDSTWAVIDPKEALKFDSNFPMFQAPAVAK
jgi:TRAP-type uncharacterized transport system substrate-binding protein